MPSLEADWQPQKIAFMSVGWSSSWSVGPCTIDHVPCTLYPVPCTMYPVPFRYMYRVKGTWYMANMMAKLQFILQLKSPCTTQYLCMYQYLYKVQGTGSGRWPTWRQNWIEVMKMPLWRHFHHHFAFINTCTGWTTGGQQEVKLVMKMPSCRLSVQEWPTGGDRRPTGVSVTLMVMWHWPTEWPTPVRGVWQKIL